MLEHSVYNSQVGGGFQSCKSNWWCQVGHVAIIAPVPHRKAIVSNGISMTHVSCQKALLSWFLSRV